MFTRDNSKTTKRKVLESTQTKRTNSNTLANLEIISHSGRGELPTKIKRSLMVFLMGSRTGEECFHLTLEKP